MTINDLHTNGAFLVWFCFVTHTFYTVISWNDCCHWTVLFCRWFEAAPWHNIYYIGCESVIRETVMFNKEYFFAALEHLTVWVSWLPFFTVYLVSILTFSFTNSLHIFSGRCVFAARCCNDISDQGQHTPLLRFMESLPFDSLRLNALNTLPYIRICTKRANMISERKRVSDFIKSIELRDIIIHFPAMNRHII